MVDLLGHRSSEHIVSTPPAVSNTPTALPPRSEGLKNQSEVWNHFTMEPGSEKKAKCGSNSKAVCCLAQFLDMFSIFGSSLCDVEALKISSGINYKTPNHNRSDCAFLFVSYFDLQCIFAFVHNMATASVAFKSREDHRKQIELEEARKAGLAPAEVDEDGKEINPHIPQYMSSAPWYLNAERPADKYRKGACENCGAMTHDAKSCMERPRKVGAKWTNKHIAPDEKIETFELDYDGKRDRWNGYDASTYARVIERYEARDEARKKYLKEQQLQKLEKSNQNGEGSASDEDEDEDDLRVDEAKVDESKQMDFAKVEKRVRTTGGGSTGTVRNLRIREDTANIFLILMSILHIMIPRQGPCVKILSQMQIQMKSHEGELKSQTKDTIIEKYGNAADEDKLPRELLLGQSERQVEYDRAGRIIKGQEAALPRSKYEEDVYINNHTTVWGSWWKDHQWGFKCCKQTVRNSYCTGAAGIEAAEAASDLMRSNLARKETAEEDPQPAEEKRLATWGTDVPDDLVLDEKLLADALKKEDQRKREEKDERKRKYNVRWNDEVTAEDMEAYRMKKVHHDDPMKNFLH
ncbi:Pre-mRNA splicing Prp18-interacting factor [Sesbania bispinosa]|nr:Pre-mRNA splicing Prp18-interacting factor [Sesbania bispinosa]